MVAKWPTTTAKPIANGPAALASGLLESQTPKTVRTSTNPSRNSTPKPWISESFSFTNVLPNPVSCKVSGVKA